MSNSIEALAKRLGVENLDNTDYQLDRLEGLFPNGYADRLLSQIETATDGKRIEDVNYWNYTSVERACRNIYFSEGSGLASFYDLQIVGDRRDIRVGVSRPFVDDGGQMDIAISQFNYCQTFILFEKDGIKVAKPPQIFGAVSCECERWERYYNQYPERVIPHNEFVLKLAKHVADETAGFNRALFHHLKTWSNRGFGETVHGLVGTFHALRGMGLTGEEAALKTLQQLLLPPKLPSDSVTSSASQLTLD